MAGLEDGAQGGVVVMIFNGKWGSGFSVQADPITTLQLPSLLMSLAASIAKDMMTGEAFQQDMRS